MTTMIEQVARARCRAKGHDPDQSVGMQDGTKLRWEWMAEFVREDFEAMREATDEIPDPKVWEACIKAVLAKR